MAYYLPYFLYCILPPSTLFQGIGLVSLIISFFQALTGFDVTCQIFSSSFVSLLFFLKITDQLFEITDILLPTARPQNRILTRH